jgi:hypothetical protein
MVMQVLPCNTNKFNYLIGKHYQPINTKRLANSALYVAPAAWNIEYRNIKKLAT